MGAKLRLWAGKNPEYTCAQGHAGTVPMRLRKDAAAAVAEAIVWIERHCGGGPQQPAAAAPVEGANTGAGEAPADGAAASPAADVAEEGGDDGVEAGGPDLAVSAEEGGDGVAEGGDASLVCTTGAVSLWPGASNVIAGAANFSVDIRCGHSLR